MADVAFRGWQEGDTSLSDVDRADRPVWRLLQAALLLVHSCDQPPEAWKERNDGGAEILCECGEKFVVDRKIIAAAARWFTKVKLLTEDSSNA